MDCLVITYTFTMARGDRASFRLEIDPVSIELRPQGGGPFPEWTRLTFKRCRVCTLTPSAHPFCPIAVRLVPIVDRFKDVRSYEEVSLEVETAERTTLKVTSAQKALSSLMGLLCAVSGCPATRFLRPMARFHLPLATQEETVYRAVSTYLLSRYFMVNNSTSNALAMDVSLDPLVRKYKALEEVNTGMSERIRSGARLDAAVNAMVILDSFAKALPFAVEDSLERLRPLFSTTP